MKAGKSGFTFLEILFSMVFFMVIIASFSMVFPSGYHLNLKTYRENQGVNLADAILQEVATKPFYAGVGTRDSLQNLQQNWQSTAYWNPQALANFAQNNPALFQKYQYTLPPSTSPTPGILVNCADGTGGGCFNPASLNDNPLVQVTVNLVWTDNSNGGGIQRLITLTTYATYDR